MHVPDARAPRDPGGHGIRAAGTESFNGSTSPSTATATGTPTAACRHSSPRSRAPLVRAVFEVKDGDRATAVVAVAVVDMPDNSQAATAQGNAQAEPMGRTAAALRPAELVACNVRHPDRPPKAPSRGLPRC
jgi:hypothetical protein